MASELSRVRRSHSVSFDTVSGLLSGTDISVPETVADEMVLAVSETNAEPKMSANQVANYIAGYLTSGYDIIARHVHESEDKPSLVRVNFVGDKGLSMAMLATVPIGGVEEIGQVPCTMETSVISLVAGKWVSEHLTCEFMFDDAGLNMMEAFLRENCPYKPKQVACPLEAKILELAPREFARLVGHCENYFLSNTFTQGAYVVVSALVKKIPVDVYAKIIADQVSMSNPTAFINAVSMDPETRGGIFATLPDEAIAELGLLRERYLKVFATEVAKLDETTLEKLLH